MIINMDRKTHTGGICISIIYISQSVQCHFCVYFQGWPFGTGRSPPWGKLTESTLSFPELPTVLCTALMLRGLSPAHFSMFIVVLTQITHNQSCRWDFMDVLSEIARRHSKLSDPLVHTVFLSPQFCSLFHRSFMLGNFAHLWFCFVPFPVVWLVHYREHIFMSIKFLLSHKYFYLFLCQWRNAKYLQSPILNSVLTNVMGNQDIYKRIIPYGAQNWGFCPSKL